MSIVSNNLPDNIAKEFTINTQGQGFISRRGVARLSGVHHKSIQKLLNSIKGGDQKLPKNLKPFAGQAFESGDQLPDTLASAIIKYYSRQGKETAQNTDDTLGAIGLRVVIQKMLDWEAPRKLTEQEVVELMCLPVPTKWQPRFSVEFYNELSRLTGLTPVGNKRPLLWAKITKGLVYDYMPTGVYKEIKSWQLATDPTKKLHQYLSDSGIELLGAHLQRVITLMQASNSLTDVELMLNQSITQSYQPSIFSIK